MSNIPAKLTGAAGPGVASPVAKPYMAQKAPKAVTIGGTPNLIKQAKTPGNFAGATPTPNLMKHAKPVGNFDSSPSMSTPNLSRQPHKRNV